MMRHTITLVAVLTLVAASCGGNGEGTMTAETATSATVAASTTTTTGAATTTTTATSTTSPTTAPPATECPPGDVATGTSRCYAESAGQERSYLIHVPASYDGSTPMPLVFEFHSYGSQATEQVEYSGLSEFGETAGFITVTPNGRQQRWLHESTATNPGLSPDEPDIVFVLDLIELLSQSLHVDQDRIYATGGSNGGWMTCAVGCMLADTFAAIAPVGGIIEFGEECQPEVPVPSITFHGTADLFLPYYGGSGKPITGPNPDLSVPERVAMWADRNGCDPDPREETISDEVTRLVHDCPPSAAVELYRIEGGGHTWPGRPGWTDIAGPVTMDIDANEIMWEFFTEQGRTD